MKQAYLRGGERTRPLQMRLRLSEDEIRVDLPLLANRPTAPRDAAANHDMLLVGSKGRRVHYVLG